MSSAVSIGSKVRHRGDDGWSAPGCVMSRIGDRVRVFWPDEDRFTEEAPEALVPYDQSLEAVA